MLQRLYAQRSWLLVAALMLIPTFASAQVSRWQSVGSDYLATAVSGNVIVAVGRYGAVLVSHDYGSSWRATHSGTWEDLKEVFFVDDRTVVAVGDSTTVLRSTNAGLTWQAAESPAYAVAGTASHAAQGTAYLVVDQNRVMASTDKGKSWHLRSAFPSESVYSMEIGSAEKGIALADSSRIWYTTDGGTSWSRSLQPPGPELFDLDFAEDGRAIAVGRAGAVIRSEDAGRTWTTTAGLGGAMDAFTVAFDAGKAVAGGAPGSGSGAVHLAISTDFGQTWQPTPLARVGQPSLIVTSVEVDASGLMAAVGTHSTVFVRTAQDTAWTAVTSAMSSDPVLGVAPLNGVAFATDSIAIIPNHLFGNGGYLRTTDGGATWNYDYRIASGAFLVPTFITSSFGYTITDDHSLFVTTDAGTSWKPRMSTERPPAILTYDAQFIDSSIGFSVADNFVYRSSDGGATWTGVQIDSAIAISRINVVGPDVILIAAIAQSADTAVPTSSRVYRSTDGGATWSTIFVRNGMGSVRSVKFLDSTTGFVAHGTPMRVPGARAAIFQTTDGGNTWDSVEMDQLVTDIAFKSREVGYAVGDGFAIWSTEDGGETWQREDTWTPGPQERYPFFTRVAVSSNGESVIATGNGTIARLAVQIVDTAAAVRQTAEHKSLSVHVFPNPARTNVTIVVDGVIDFRHQRLQMHDVLGNAVDLRGRLQTGSRGSQSVGVIDVSGLEKGAYYVVIHDGVRTYRGQILIDEP